MSADAKPLTHFRSLGDPPFLLERVPVALAELFRAGIVAADVDSDLKAGDKSQRAHVVAQLGDLRLSRYWRYWVSKGPVPIEVALRLYADPAGRATVRVAGSCTCPPPAEWVEVVDGKPCITTYHVDSEEGLKLFVAAMQAHWVEKEGRR
jgi:hypothetical protein